MAGCAAVGIEHLGFAVETSLILFHVLDPAGPFTPPFESHYNVDTGEFSHERALVSDPGNSMQIAGVVAPLATVGDGLQQYDNFTVAWTMKPRGATEDVADGEISSAYAGFQTTNAAADTLNGYLTVDPVNDVGSVTGFYDGTSYTCSIDLETYAVDCSGN